MLERDVPMKLLRCWLLSTLGAVNCLLCTASWAAESDTPEDFATQKRGYEERIASYAKIDAHAPRTLRERYEYGRFLESSAEQDCMLRLEAAQQQIESVLAADEQSRLLTTDIP